MGAFWVVLAQYRPYSSFSANQSLVQPVLNYDKHIRQHVDFKIVWFQHVFGLQLQFFLSPLVLMICKRINNCTNHGTVCIPHPYCYLAMTSYYQTYTYLSQNLSLMPMMWGNLSWSNSHLVNLLLELLVTQPYLHSSSHDLSRPH